MGQLTLTFLGDPTVQIEGQRLAFPTRQTLALLVYLVVEGGTHRRDKLAALFWPHFEAGQARPILRTTLARLRQALGRDNRYLIITPDTLGFNFMAPFELDLHLLQAATQTTRMSGSPVAILQQAVERYRGDFLEGFSLPDAPDFDDWVTFQRETWHYRIGLVFDRLSQWQAEAGDSKSAIETTRRWLVHHPFDESAHRRLMQLHFVAGDRTAALQAYEVCRTTLQEELAVAPDAETEALAERIRSEMSSPLELPELSPAWSLPIDFPLVGRATEHLQLVSAYQAARRGRTQAVALIGEAGIGKSRLATEFLRWAIGQGAEVLPGRAFETGGRVPYQPLVQALRPRLEQENAPDDLLADVWLTELSRLLPELRDRYPDLPPPNDADPAAQARLFESVARLVEALAQRKPVVVLMDDLHWADAASLDLLQYAASRWAENGLPLLLLLNIRREALDRSGSQPPLTLRDWLAQLERVLPLSRLALGPLSAGDIVQLVEMLKGPGPGMQSEEAGQPTRENSGSRLEDHDASTIHYPPASPAFAQWLFHETSGQPFFMVETLKVLFERHIIVAYPGQPGEWMIDFSGAEAWLKHEQAALLIPPGIQALIESRLAQLSQAAFAFLAAGAVLGQTFEFRHLCQVAGLNEDEGLRALDELLPGQLLRPVRQRRKQATTYLYSFSHDKIRGVVYGAAGDSRRAIFHRRAFELLQATPASPATLAHHALQAGLTEAACHYSLAAGDEALRLFAVRDAIAHFEQAQALLTGDGEPEHVTRTCGGAGEPPFGTEQKVIHARLGANEVPKGGFALAQRGQSPLVAGSPKSAGGTQSDSQNLHHLYLQLGRAYELDNQYERAETIYEALLALAKQGDRPDIACEALNRLAKVVAWHDVQLDRAAALLQQALQLADRSDNQVSLAETTWNLAQLNFYNLEARTALGYAEQALTLARALQLPELMARSLNVMAYAELLLGRWGAVVGHAQEGQALFATLGNRAMEVDCLCQLAIAQINSGQPQAGLQAGRTAHALSLEIGNSWGQIHSAAQLVPGLLDTGEYGQALALAQQSVTLARSQNITFLLPICLLRLGAVYRTLSSLETARSTLLEAKTANQRNPAQPFKAAIAAELCAVSILLGEWSDASTYAMEVFQADNQVLLYTGFTCWFELEVLRRAGDPEQAQERLLHLEQQAGGNPRLRLAYLRAWVELNLSPWDRTDPHPPLSTQADKESIITSLEEANLLAEEMGLPTEQWQILATLGVWHKVSGDEARSRQAFGQALKIIQALAAKIDDEPLQAGFLAAEPVQRVLQYNASP